MSPEEIKQVYGWPCGPLSLIVVVSSPALRLVWGGCIGLIMALSLN